MFGCWFVLTSCTENFLARSTLNSITLERWGISGCLGTLVFFFFTSIMPVNKFFLSMMSSAYFHFEAVGPETVCMVCMEAHLLRPYGILWGRFTSSRGNVRFHGFRSPKVPEDWGWAEEVSGRGGGDEKSMSKRGEKEGKVWNYKEIQMRRCEEILQEGEKREWCMNTSHDSSDAEHKLSPVLLYLSEQYLETDGCSCCLDKSRDRRTKLTNISSIVAP